MKTLQILIFAAAGTLLCAVPLQNAGAQSGNPCPTFPAGSTITEPENLSSHNRVLRVNLSYETGVDQNGNATFCYLLGDGQRSPTLHINPGDHLILTLTNDTPAAASSSALQMQMSPSNPSEVCGAATMNDSSTNVHFHGTNTSPTCGQDEVIHTLINSGQTFTYDVKFPANEPPGLYWYHPHVHGLSEAAVQGGASGAIIVNGIQDVQPRVAGLPQRLLIVRDNPVPGNPDPGGPVPSWDLSLNYVPVSYTTNYLPAVIQMRPKKREFWRILNASADSILDLQLQYDGVAQPLKIVALDGVPTGSQNGAHQGMVVTKTDILLAPAARAEFIVTGPTKTVQNATLMTLNVDTGPDGDDDPTRPLATIQVVPVGRFAAADATVGSANTNSLPTTPPVSATPPVSRFDGLADAKVTHTRSLYFSEVLSDPNNPNSPTNFFITVVGQTPTLFSPSNPPAIVTTQGSVEDWTIENRSFENHVFHLHQTHFLLLERNGVPVAKSDRQMLDTIQVPYWTGSGPYPSVTVRVDFRGPDIGNFVYHCHILGHEDNGMMAIIQVLPRGSNQQAIRAGAGAALASYGSTPGAAAAWCVNGGKVVIANASRANRPRPPD
ncbi:MAG TPA: multicopper oxidase domain-containing protein [Candidatus Binataceae bacterium]|nr:multicopper oxidase domain-containing protein [Candidatus Binataceae bacterium]